MHPVLLSHMIGFISNYDKPGSQSIEYGYFYAIGIFLVAISKTLVNQQVMSRGYVTNFRINASLKTAIYRKTLTMSNDSRNKYSIGEIISRMSFDTAEVSYFVGDMSYQMFGYPLYGNSSHGPLTLKLVFVSMALFEMIKTPIVQMPQVIASLINARVAFERLEDFLTCNEVDARAINHEYYDRESVGSSIDDVMVSMENASFKWLLTDSEPQIKNVDLVCRQDELVAVIGKVGSGKSSLTSAILGDMTRVSGNVDIKGSIAYVSQQPWIINASLRDNILFGHEMEPEFYHQVIDACALRPDLDVLPAGDLTEIGEKGINLSGGQKARLSLARAVYARADIYILDDPLAAVDTHVSKHLFSHVIGPLGLLSSRARILVTNAVQYLQKADSVYMLDQGHVVENGSYSKCMSRQNHIYKFVHRYIVENKLSETDMDLTSSSVTLVNRPYRLGKARKTNVLRAESDTHAEENSSNGGQLITEEVNKQGKVTTNVYWAYVKACGLNNVVVYFIVQVLASAASVASNFWLKNWASKNEKSMEPMPPTDPAEHTLSQQQQEDVMYYLVVYGLLGLLGAGLGSLRSLILQANCSIKASEKTHYSMLKGVMRSPMEYFDRTPMGRIVNRFSSDILTVDYTIPWAMSSLLSMAFGIVSSVSVIGITTPVLIIALVPIAFIYRYIQRLYVSTSREITRINASTRSPIVAHLQETIGGISSIRAYRQQQRFVADNEKYMENNVRAAYSNICIMRWLSLRLESLGDFVLLGTTMLAIVMLHFFGIADAGAVGLSITYAVSMTSLLGSSLSCYVEAENAMTNLERIIEYADLPAEAPETLEHSRPEQSWPAQGQVEFRNYSTKYREGLECVLKNVSFRVEPMQKIGIVGRTGAGKSSLTLALFRIIEATAGQILVDGQDISQYGLLDVRSKLSIIPQDPVLFAGTIRENVDPLGVHGDLEIWHALAHAHLAEFIRSKDQGLDLEVTHGGNNFSVGQRQLVCLARALLKRAKVLVLDEATAAIDNITDNIVQQSIREQFRDCTVLTIAHRPNTIIDSDKILVIDNGEVAEYDTPGNLLADPNSLFTHIVSECDSQS
ncbi:hypothetical protein GGF40_003368 [Coemansia sp. RSA 1286]|nr:hypothetical protein GGF40_003368 [Coemansia sp. RSA 1286]